MFGRAVCSTVAVAVAAATVVGCTQHVSGTAAPARTTAADDDRSYGYVDNRCGLLTDTSVQQTLGADEVVRPYSGAVCQYVLVRQRDTIDVTFVWFGTGSLSRERAVAVERGAEVRDTEVERRQAFVARRDTIGSGCTAAAAAGGGVLSWWVQARGDFDTDPCPDAEKLLSATLRSDL
ncbi:DUF3558 family protein [Mycobacterium sp. C31M]